VAGDWVSQLSAAPYFPARGCELGPQHPSSSWTELLNPVVDFFFFLMFSFFKGSCQHSRAA